MLLCIPSWGRFQSSSQPPFSAGCTSHPGSWCSREALTWSPKVHRNDVYAVILLVANLRRVMPQQGERWVRPAGRVSAEMAIKGPEHMAAAWQAVLCRLWQSFGEGHLSSPALPGLP